MPIPSYTSSQSFLAISWVSAQVTVINTNAPSAALRARTTTSRKKAASFPVALGEFGYDVTR